MQLITLSRSGKFPYFYLVLEFKQKSFRINTVEVEGKSKEETTNYYNYFEDVLLQQEYDEITAFEDNRPSTIESFLTTTHCFYIYSSIIVAVIFFTIFRSVVLYNFCMKASIKLHNSMFMKVLNSNMRFFNNNPSGRILNKFSKDLGTIDETCPYVLMDTFQVRQHNKSKHRF